MKLDIKIESAVDNAVCIIKERQSEIWNKGVKEIRILEKELEKDSTKRLSLLNKYEKLILDMVSLELSLLSLEDTKKDVSKVRLTTVMNRLKERFEFSRLLEEDYIEDTKLLYHYNGHRHYTDLTDLLK